MAAYVPPTLLAPLPEPGRDALVGGLVTGLSTFLGGSGGLLQTAGAVYGHLEAKKQAEAAAKRQQQLDLAAINAQGATGKAWLSPGLAIGGAAALAGLVLLVSMRR